MSAADVARKEEVVRGIVRWLSGFERGFQYVPEEIVDAGECVFVRIRLRGRGRKAAGLAG
ncbi:MAG: hypothetical protein ACRDMA_15935 [Solirubrobacterales bacterium]